MKSKIVKQLMIIAMVVIIFAAFNCSMYMLLTRRLANSYIRR